VREENRQAAKQKVREGKAYLTDEKDVRDKRTISRDAGDGGGAIRGKAQKTSTSTIVIRGFWGPGGAKNTKKGVLGELNKGGEGGLGFGLLGLRAGLSTLGGKGCGVDG